MLQTRRPTTRHWATRYPLRVGFDSSDKTQPEAEGRSRQRVLGLDACQKMNRPWNIGLLMALLTILGGMAWWLVDRGRNEIVITGLPAEDMRFLVIDTDHGALSGQTFTILDGEVDLGWGYSIKGSRMLIRISDETGIHYEGDLVVDQSGITRLSIPRSKS